jgi:hypothetical protein
VRLPKQQILRTVIFGIGVLILELGFIASYAGALHAPQLNQVPVAFVGNQAQQKALSTALAQHHAPVALQAFATLTDAQRAVRHGVVAGAFQASLPMLYLFVSSGYGSAATQLLTTVFQEVSKTTNIPLATHDLVPLPASNSRGLVQFYLVIGLVVGGYLFATVMGLLGDMTPRSLRRGAARLGGLALFSAVSGVLSIVIIDALFGYQSGHVVSAAAVSALIVFGTGAAAMAIIGMFGILGAGVVIILFVVLGNPSSGGAWPNVLLASPWRQLGPWLPNGAGLTAMKDVLFFDSYGVTSPLLVLSGYAAVGLVLTLLVAWRGRALVTLPVGAGFQPS